MRTERWATPATIGAFVVTGGTGMLMFFHLNTGWMKTAHEWVGWLAVAAIVMHALVNWGAFKRHLRNRVGLAVCSAFLLCGLLPALSSGGKSAGNPVRQVLGAMEQAPLSVVSGVAGCTPELLTEKLEAAGVDVQASSHTIRQIAQQNQRNSMELLALIFSGTGKAESAGRPPAP